MEYKINNFSTGEEKENKLKLSRENAQLHMHSEKLARILKKWLDDPNMKYFWTAEDREALSAYNTFKEHVIWNSNYTPPAKDI
jgi:hypothetical protein